MPWRPHRDTGETSPQSLSVQTCLKSPHAWVKGTFFKELEAYINFTVSRSDFSHKNILVEMDGNTSFYTKVSSFDLAF